MVTTDDEPSGSVTVRVDGELDLATHDETRARLREVAGRLGGPVRLDLGGLAFCDVVGVDVLREFVEVCRARGCDVSIVEAPRLVRVIAEVVRAELPFA